MKSENDCCGGGGGNYGGGYYYTDYGVYLIVFVSYGN